MLRLKLNQNNPNTCDYTLPSEFYGRSISQEGVSLILRTCCIPSATRSALRRFHLIPPTSQRQRQTTAKGPVAQKACNSLTMTKRVNEETEIQTHNNNASHCLFPNIKQRSSYNVLGIVWNKAPWCVLMLSSAYPLVLSFPFKNGLCVLFRKRKLESSKSKHCLCLLPIPCLGSTPSACHSGQVTCRALGPCTCLHVIAFISSCLSCHEKLSQRGKNNKNKP